MIRVHEQVDEYSLTDLYDLLMNHEDELNMWGDTVTNSGTGG